MGLSFLLPPPPPPLASCKIHGCLAGGQQSDTPCCRHWTNRCTWLEDTNMSISTQHHHLFKAQTNGSSTGPACCLLCPDLRPSASPGDSTAVCQPAALRSLIGSVSPAGIGGGCGVQNFDAARAAGRILTSQGLPWSRISSWCRRRASSTSRRRTRRSLSPFLTGGSRGGRGSRGEEGREERRGDDTLPEDLCSQLGASTEDAKTKSSALVWFADSFLALLPDSWCLFCPRWQTGAPGDRFVLARRGYLTNPLDDTEPPHRDGETHRLFFAPSSLFTSLAFLFCFPGGIFCQRRTAVLSRPGQGALLAAEGATLSGASKLPRRTVVCPPRGCYSDGRSERLPLLPLPRCDVYPTDLSVRTAPIDPSPSSTTSYDVQHMAVLYIEVTAFVPSNRKGVARIHRVQTCSTEPPRRPHASTTPPPATQTERNIIK